MTIPRTAMLCLVSAMAAAALMLGISAATSGAHGNKDRGDHGAKNGAKHFGGWHKAKGHGVVHSETVFAKKDGTFVKAVTDRGFVKAVAGDQLTVTQGTKKATYGETTVTVPAGSKVVVNRNKDASLNDVKAGQKVLVTQLGDKVAVWASDVPPATTAKKR